MPRPRFRPSRSHVHDLLLLGMSRPPTRKGTNVSNGPKAKYYHSLHSTCYLKQQLSFSALDSTCHPTRWLSTFLVSLDTSSTFSLDRNPIPVTSDVASGVRGNGRNSRAPWPETMEDRGWDHPARTCQCVRRRRDAII